MFPLRPYMPYLVETLEDTDGVVRECARQAVVELFSAPQVTDTARGDLKKEMARKGVRKNIVDSVLLKLLSAGYVANGSAPQSETSETADPPKRESAFVPNRRPAVPITRSFSSSTALSLAESSSRPASRLGLDVPSTPSSETAEISPFFVSYSVLSEL